MNKDQQHIADLITAVKSGNQEAYTQLYEAISSRLFGIQLRILKDKNIAEDALQETFIKVWKNAARYDSTKASPNVWLNALARNQALDILRRSHTRADVNLFVTEDHAKTITDSYAGLDENLADNQVLNLCLQRLQEDAQRCIVGIYCEGHTQDELSSLLGKPIGTVKSWIRRSLQRLKECVDELS